MTIFKSLCVYLYVLQKSMCVSVCIAKGWRRPIRCLIFIGHFPQKSPIISGSLAENDLRLRGLYSVLQVSLCHITVSHHCATSLCHVTVSLCNITVPHHCVTSLCHITVSLCHITVSRDCATSLCHITVPHNCVT